ncbi:MAG TPA: hypothetical protein VHO48_14740 [Anaerolineaceae bacterium]|nr:hypothetical protein [Anaerolineaceae bacterium]
MSRLVERCPAQRALVAESAGQVIAYGGTEYFANPQGLAALAAGYMSAGQAITYLTEPVPIEQFILREGRDTFTFLYEAGQHLILFVQVAKEVPLGWARITVQEAGQELTNIMTQTAGSPENAEPDWKPADLSGEVNDALNSLWEGFS